MIGTTILCLVIAATDADTLRCHEGTRIRLAGISALERNGSCNSTPDCPTMHARLATPIAQRLTVGRTFRFTIHGRSGKRLVGDNRGLRCSLIASGAAVEWRYWSRRYGLEACR